MLLKIWNRLRKSEPKKSTIVEKYSPLDLSDVELIRWCLEDTEQKNTDGMKKKPMPKIRVVNRPRKYL